MAPLVSGGSTQPIDADCSTLAVPSKFVVVDGVSTAPGVDCSTGSSATGPWGMRGGVIRVKRLVGPFGSSVGGSAGMSRNAGEVSWAVGRATSGCPAEGAAPARSEVSAIRTAITTTMGPSSVERTCSRRESQGTLG